MISTIFPHFSSLRYSWWCMELWPWPFVLTASQSRQAAQALKQHKEKAAMADQMHQEVQQDEITQIAQQDETLHHGKSETWHDYAASQAGDNGGELLKK